MPGVNLPLYSMGSRMVASYGLGPVVHGIGLFQPVISYNNSITISAVADRDMLPDPAFYAECLEAAYDELRSATLGDAGKPRKVRAASKKKSAKKKTRSRKKTRSTGKPKSE